MRTGIPVNTQTHGMISSGLQIANVPPEVADFSAHLLEGTLSIFSGRGFFNMPVAASRTSTVLGLANSESRFAASPWLSRPSNVLEVDMWDNPTVLGRYGREVESRPIYLNTANPLNQNPQITTASLRHESVHRFLDKATGGRSWDLYYSKNTPQYALFEEIVAETWATGNPIKGVVNSIEFNDMFTRHAAGYLYHANKNIQGAATIAEILGRPVGGCAK